MLEDRFTRVLGAQTREGLQEEVVSFARRFGFDTVSATLAVDHPFRQTEFVTVDNTPMDYRDSFENLENARRDPVMQHCRQTGVPIIWDQATYVQHGVGDKWEHQAHFGYRCGIAMALHMPNGRHFFIGVDRDQPVPEDTIEITRLVAELQLFAVVAQDAASRVLEPKSREPNVPDLTRRELETLQWTMNGKTAWEVGAILGFNEGTAIKYLKNAMTKLECVNKLQAVVRAMQLGIIR